MGWKPSGGSDADAIHDNVASEISAITEKASPVNADLVVIEDSAAANVKKRVQVGNLPGAGGDVPGWVSFLAARQTGETSHTDDLFFTGSSGGTVQTVSGGGTWTELYGLQSVRFANQTNLDSAAILWAITSASSPMTFETAVQAQLVDISTVTLGVCMTDGTATSSNMVMARIFTSTSAQGFRNTAGTLTDWSATYNDSVQTPQDRWNSGLLYMRIAWTAANSFKAGWSSDGVSWVDYAASAQSKTMTPTHYGLIVSTGGNAEEQTAAFHYIRVADADLTSGI